MIKIFNYQKECDFPYFGNQYISMFQIPLLCTEDYNRKMLLCILWTDLHAQWTDLPEYKQEKLEPVLGQLWGVWIISELEKLDRYDTNHQVSWLVVYTENRRNIPGFVCFDLFLRFWIIWKFQWLISNINHLGSSPSV